jgi:probable HAF family extracellular repeat protein
LEGLACHQGMDGQFCTEPFNLPSGGLALIQTDLGMQGGDFSRANAINPAGDVVGVSTTTSGENRATLWTRSSVPSGGVTHVQSPGHGHELLQGLPLCATVWGRDRY